MINIGNSKKPTLKNHQLKIVIRKNIAYCKIFFEMFVFSSHIYLEAIFYIA